MTGNDDSRMTTGPLGGTEQTTGEDVAMSATHDDWQDQSAEGFGPGAYEQSTDDGTGPAEPAPRLSRPKGPSWGTVALGLICVLVAGGALWVEWADVTLDWTRSGPLMLVGVGLVLVLVGLAALVRRGDEDEEPGS
ncbi:hypothetical protein MWU75_00495 [Ornithinimicrobium sp. F0845]|uniref:hypothetical protein n=1 Tax=Ornithinimicrobium sp. F0845 TaxID=2926412 RepID=UPI001FF2B90B|nr:hypothetical protein [Ornithinimicrobium sp. F0845]MCK0110624.1 hypothetical protein [Ornithinimicrobium sp. F0845]